VKAIVATRPGNPSVFEWRELAKPEPGQGELLVRLRAAGLNPVDYKLRRRGSFAPTGTEVILGCDGAGIVEAVGADTTRFVAGDEVFFCDGGFGEKPGNYAEYHVIDERFAARKPERLSFVEAAALPLVTITAWESLFNLASIRAGDFVLVQAGAGGVGHVAVQLARDAGAFVAATISTPEKAALARELGAVATIDYRTEDVAAATRSWSGRDGANVVFDTLAARRSARASTRSRRTAGSSHASNRRGPISRAHSRSIAICASASSGCPRPPSTAGRARRSRSARSSNAARHGSTRGRSA